VKEVRFDSLELPALHCAQLCTEGKQNNHGGERPSDDPTGLLPRGGIGSRASVKVGLEMDKLKNGRGRKVRLIA